MKLYASSILIFLTFFSAQAQTAEVRGKLQDAETRDPIAFANVVLLNPEDSSMVKGATTDLSGSFKMEVAQGTYILRATFLGYAPLRQTVVVDDAMVNLQKIQLEPAVENLDEVTVSGVTSMFESDIDKRTYDVENSVLSEGATAIEVLNTLPSVQIDEEGGISMRGSGNVLIYVNGRPTNLSSADTESILAQFPANSIKSIELITNPSSRYDAAGVGGIINVILKNEKRVGFNGQANASVGTRNKYQAGVNLNYRTEKWNFFANYNYQFRNLYEESKSLRISDDPSVSRFLDQDFDTDNDRQAHLLRTGLDYTIKEGLVAGIYTQYNYNSRDRIRIYNQRHQNANRELDSLFNRTLTEDQFSTNIETGATLNWDIDTLGQQLYTSFSWARNMQEHGRPQDGDLFIGQVDWEKPVGNNSKIEAGLKTTVNLHDRGQTFDQQNLSTGVYEENDTIANRFLFDEYVYASYAIYRGELSKLSYQAGLRLEHTETEGYDYNSETTYPNAYTNLFPSLYLAYDMGSNQELQVNYSRRINRPSVGQLHPFYNAQDLLNTRFGNPNLQPEYTDSYELGYVKNWENYQLNSTLYHRRTSNAMTRIYQLLGENRAVQLWDNVANRYDTGLEIINQFSLGANFNTTLSGNFFYSEVIGENIEDGFNNSNFTWTLSWLTSWYVKDIATFQVQADYRGPIVLPQGEIDPIYGINIGIRRNILNDKATISFNVSDILNTRIFNIETSGRNFSQQREFNRETRIATVSFSYRFGGFKTQSEKTDAKFMDDPF
ncbi:MAG: TonB-dependent receptor family protein [Flavobacteriales bacterium]|nr:TonB-dependent receptor family protein [Flavobacteriales bacterium]